MHTGKTTNAAPRSSPFNAAEHLRSEADVAAYIEAMLEDGDARAVPVALRTVVDAMGGMAALADKTGPVGSLAARKIRNSHANRSAR
jgi:DNA-binding phage protein